MQQTKLVQNKFPSFELHVLFYRVSVLVYPTAMQKLLDTCI